MAGGRGRHRSLAYSRTPTRKATASPVKRTTAPATGKGRRRRQPLRKRLGGRKRWLILGFPVAVFAGLLALAPGTPDPGLTPRTDQELEGDALGPFRYQPDDEVYALDFDPRKVRLGLLEGWDREQDAFEDSAALAYVSGPMYERHIDSGGQEITVPLGDLKFGQRIWRGRNRTASRQRAFVGIRDDGRVDFGYGELTPEREQTYDMFIGGLHSVYNDLEQPPDSYKGAYSISMGQRIRYYLPRIRMIFGLRSDGRLEMLMSKDGLTLEQTRELARRRGLVAAYMPDHASKSRLIIPGVKGFTEEDANWISGGATSFVHVPYLLRLSERRNQLQGGLVANLSERLQTQASCNGPADCVQMAGSRLADRALAGLNRVMEQGVEPIARMIWTPKPMSRESDMAQPTTPGTRNRSPLPEPPITADPLVLLEQPLGDDLAAPLEPTLPPIETDLPPDLPPPEVIEPRLREESPGTPAENNGQDPSNAMVGAPPPPLLPPPLP